MTKRILLLIEFYGSMALIIISFWLLAGCSSGSERFDTRPEMCKAIGKTGRDC